MSTFKDYRMALFVWTSWPTFPVLTMFLHAMNICIFNVIDDAVAIHARRCPVAHKHVTTSTLTLSMCNLRMSHVENGTTYCVRFCAWAWTWHMLCLGTSIETCNNLSITFCQVSYTTSISLSEHEQNALRTCTQYWFQCVKRSSNFESRRERCQLGHLRIFSSVFTSSCHRVIPKPSSSGMCHAMLLLLF